MWAGWKLPGEIYLVKWNRVDDPRAGKTFLTGIRMREERAFCWILRDAITFWFSTRSGRRRVEADFSLRYRDWEIMFWGGFGFDLKWKGALVYFCLWAWSVELHQWWGWFPGWKERKDRDKVDPDLYLFNFVNCFSSIYCLNLNHISGKGRQFKKSNYSNTVNHQRSTHVIDSVLFTV